MRLLAIDPGKVTGLARLCPDVIEAPVFDSWQLPADEAVDWLFENLGRYDGVAVEAYVVTQATLRKSRGDNWSLEQIGVCRHLARRQGVPFALQTPADAKSFATDEKLRKLGWYTPTPGGHANDAARHLLLYGVRAGAVLVADLV